jgi:threonine aldolase
LKIDHDNATRLARGLRELKLETTQNTNMVLVRVPQEKVQELSDYLRDKQILVLPRAPMRLVTHLDVDAEGIDRALAGFWSFFAPNA